MSVDEVRAWVEPSFVSILGPSATVAGTSHWTVSLRTNKKGAWGRTSLWLDFVSGELAKEVFFKHTTFYQPDSTFGGIQWTLQSQHWAVESEEQVLASFRGLSLKDIAERRKMQETGDADLPTSANKPGMISPILPCPFSVPA